MGIEQAQALHGQLIKVGGGNFGLIVVAAQVTVSEVIGQDQNDVGGGLGLGTGRGLWSPECCKK
jgi:hypothetical protein